MNSVVKLQPMGYTRLYQNRALRTKVYNLVPGILIFFLADQYIIVRIEDRARLCELEVYFDRGALIIPKLAVAQAKHLVGQTEYDADHSPIGLPAFLIRCKVVIGQLHSSEV